MTDVPAATAVVRRLLPAAPELVYDEWLDPEALREWMCPRPARAGRPARQRLDRDRRPAQRGTGEPTPTGRSARSTCRILTFPWSDQPLDATPTLADHHRL